MFDFLFVRGGTGKPSHKTKPTRDHKRKIPARLLLTPAKQRHTPGLSLDSEAVAPVLLLQADQHIVEVLVELQEG